MNTFTKSLTQSLMVVSVLSLSALVAQAQDSSTPPASSTASSTVSSPVSPETKSDVKAGVKADRQELKKDIQQVKEDKDKLTKDKSSNAAPAQIASDKKDLKAARKARHQAKHKLQLDKKPKMEVKQ